VAAQASSRADRIGLLVACLLLLAAAVQVSGTIFTNMTGGWPAYDTNAYWLATRRLLEGSPLYRPALIWTAGAYKYPPVFAQIVLPIGVLPEWAVDWTWRIVRVLCLRYLSGSCRLRRSHRPNGLYSWS
jgi:hypothetical protein